MRYDVLYNFISPVTGRLPLQEGYTFIGDKDGFTKQSSFPIDTKQDLIDLRRDLDKTNVLTRGSLWMGNAADKKEEVTSIGVLNLPELGAAIFPIPLLSVEIPVPNPTFDPLSPLAYLMSSPWLPQIYAGTTNLLNTTNETKISSTLALTQINTAQAIKRLDNAGFIVKNKTINYSWENPAYDLVTDPYLIAAMELYGLGTSYTFNEAQALDELGAGMVSNDADGNLSITTLTHNNIWVGDSANRPVEVPFELAPNNATYILQTPDAALPNSQALSEAVHEFTIFGGLLKTGLNGVVYLAKGGTEVDVTGTFSVDDYVRPIDLYEFKQQYNDDFFPFNAATPTIPTGDAIAAAAVLTATTDANLNMKQIRVNIGDDTGDLTHPYRYSQLTSDYPNTILGGDNIGGYVTPSGSFNQFVPALLKKHIRILEDFDEQAHTDEYVNYQHISFDNGYLKPSYLSLVSGVSSLSDLLGYSIITEERFNDLLQPSGDYDVQKGFLLDGEFGFNNDNSEPKALHFKLLKYRDNKYYFHDQDQIENIFSYYRESDSINFSKDIAIKSGTTAQRPVNPLDYSIRVNTDSYLIEFYEPITNSWITSSGGGGVQSIGLETNSPSVASIGTNTTNPINNIGTFTINFSSRLQELADMSNFSFSGIPYYNFNELTESVSIGYYKMALDGSDGIIVEKTLDENIDKIGYINIKAEPINLTGVINGNGNLGTNINTSFNHEVIFTGPDQILGWDFSGTTFLNRSGYLHLNNQYGSRVFGEGQEGSLSFALNAYGDGVSTGFDYAGYIWESIFDLSTAGAPKTKRLELTYKDLSYNSKEILTHDVLTDSVSIKSQLAIPSGTSFQRSPTPVSGSIKINTDNAIPSVEFYENSQWYQTGTVSSVGLSTTSPGIVSITNTPVINSDTIGIELDSKLNQIASNETVGFLTATGVMGSTILPRKLQEGLGIVIQNQDGSFADPIIGLTSNTTTLTGAVSGTGTLGGIISTIIDANLDTRQYRIENMANPINSQDGVNKRYLISQIPIITGTENQISLINSVPIFPSTDPPGINIRIADNPILGGSGAMTIPKGSSLNRPFIPAKAMVRYDDILNNIEYYNNSDWLTLATVKSFVQGKLTATQTTNVSLGDHIKYNAVSFTRSNNLIAVDTISTYVTTLNVPALGRITLQPNRTYKLTAVITEVTFPSASTPIVSFTWRNVDTGTLIDNKGAIVNSTAATFKGGEAIAIAFISPIVVTRVEVYLQTTGLTNIVSSYFLVEEV